MLLSANALVLSRAQPAKGARGSEQPSLSKDPVQLRRQAAFECYLAHKQKHFRPSKLSIGQKLTESVPYCITAKGPLSLAPRPGADPAAVPTAQQPESV